MTKTFTLFLLFICSYLCSYSQHITEHNYLVYHKEILHAENLCLIGKLDKGIAAYVAIFEKYPKAFAKDCFIALQICAYAKDTANAPTLFKKGFENGISWSIAISSRHVRDLFRHYPYLEKKMKKVYNVCREPYINSLDLALRYKIYNMKREDGYYKLKVNHQQDVWDTLGEANYTKVLDEHARFMSELLNTRSYPGEHVIGIYDKEIDNVPENMLVVDGDTVDFWHNTSNLFLTDYSNRLFLHHPFLFQKLQSKLLDAVMNGELSPREYAFYSDWSYASLLKARLRKKHENEIVYYGTSKENILKYQYTPDSIPRTCNYNMFIKSNYNSQDTALVNMCRNELNISSTTRDLLIRSFEKRYDIKMRFGLFRNL